MLGRYLLREVLPPYLLGTLLFIALITTDLLASLSGVFLRQGTPLGEILQIVLYRMPFTLGVALPLGLVFAILIGLARWVRDSELKAMYASGVSPLRLLPVLLGLSVVVAGVALFNAAWLKPEAQARYERLLYRVYYGTVPSGVLSNQAYAPAGLGVYFAARIYPDGQGGGRLENVRVVEPSGVLWSAARGVWRDANWILEDAYRITPDGTVESRSRVPLPFPAQFVPPATSYEALPLGALRELARVDPEARFPLQRRYADAVGVIALAWLAGVVGLGLREAVWAFVAIVLLIFGYFVLWTLAAQLARFALVGAYGAWLPNAVYFLLAAWGTRRLA